MPGTQELTRRIKSIKSTRKITRAMQMVSAAKMRKAQERASQSRSYTSLAMQLIRELPGVPARNPLLRTYPQATKIGVIVISTNKGLVGSFNANIMAALQQLERQYPNTPVEVIGKGRKICEACARMQKNLIASFTKHEALVGISDIYDLSKLICKRYTAGEYQKVYIIYNHFYSTLVQKVTTITLLPFNESDSGKAARGGGSIRALPVGGGDASPIIEPSPEQVFDHLLPRVIESQIYQALLESDASEHSSRMVMMKNATEAAGDIISDLTLTYNQLRQNKITTELSEITAGKIALENK
ncbi:MAG TPA: ATP synthase F1 subunit gamma [Patescibacteria group bacterium]|nr:ATP synthase F1 subunit gamma [Patescibacteria group bacterium]